MSRYNENWTFISVLCEVSKRRSGHRISGDRFFFESGDFSNGIIDEDVRYIQKRLDFKKFIPHRCRWNK